MTTVGVSNFNCQAIRDLLSYCTVPPAANQIELHPYNTQEHLVRYCQQEGIVVTGAISRFHVIYFVRCFVGTVL